jgi:hypothetical protein
MTEIMANVIALDKSDALLAEIDENLKRQDLTVLEQGEHLQRREELLTAKGLRAQVGEGRPPLENPAKSAALKTTSDIGKEVGLSERSVRSRTKIAKDLPQSTRDLVRETPLANNQEALTQLAKIAKTSPQKADQAADKVITGTARNVAQAERQIDKKPEPLPQAKHDYLPSDITDLTEDVLDYYNAAELETLLAKLRSAIDGVIDVNVDPLVWPPTRPKSPIAMANILIANYNTRELQKIFDGLGKLLGRHDAPLSHRKP